LEVAMEDTLQVAIKEEIKTTPATAPMTEIVVTNDEWEEDLATCYPSKETCRKYRNAIYCWQDWAARKKKSPCSDAITQFLNAY
jgi:hypothetical protein